MAHLIAVVLWVAIMALAATALRVVTVRKAALITAVTVHKVTKAAGQVMAAAMARVWVVRLMAAAPEWAAMAVLLMVAIAVAQLPVVMAQAGAAIMAAVQIWAPVAATNLKTMAEAMVAVITAEAITMAKGAEMVL